MEVLILFTIVGLLMALYLHNVHKKKIARRKKIQAIKQKKTQEEERNKKANLPFINRVNTAIKEGKLSKEDGEAILETLKNN